MSGIQIVNLISQANHRVLDSLVVPHEMVQHPLHIEVEHAFSLEYPGNVLDQAYKSRAVAFATVDSEEIPDEELLSVHKYIDARVIQFVDKGAEDSL